MSYLANYSSLLQKMIDKYHQRNFTQTITEIELDKPVVNPLDSLVTSEQIWIDGHNAVELNEFNALSLVGPQGSGKTSIAKQVATFAKSNDYRLIYAMPDDYMTDVNSWIAMATLESRSHTMIILDDLSYFSDAQAKKQASLVKNMIARLRHIFKSKIFVVFITHRLHATPPMLRNSPSWIFTDMQIADRDDALEIIGRNKEQRDRLEEVYTFMSRIKLEASNPDRLVHYKYQGQEFTFKWGDKIDSADGRIMAIYHGGVMKLYHSKVIDTSINFEDYRFIPKMQLVS